MSNPQDKVAHHVIGILIGEYKFKFANHALIAEVVKDALEIMAQEKGQITEDHLLYKVCIALGWQGGTIHQALDEIRRLKAYERDTLINKGACQ